MLTFVLSFRQQGLSCLWNKSIYQIQKMEW